MSNTKHTPGPWTVRYQYNVFAGKRSIAGCGGYTSNDPNEDTHEVNMANAHLIAAAPDLLAACKEARQWLGDAPPDGEGEFYNELRRVLSVMDAAIAKGEA